MKHALLAVTLLLGLGRGAPPPAEAARENAEDARKAILFSKRLTHGWLDQANTRSGLIPRNLRTDWYWNARDSAADNFPFFLLTAFITDSYYLKRATLHMLEQEQKLTNRLDRLPDDFLFDRQDFRAGDFDLDQVIFGASEYAKDGLTPITEWLGPGPWLDRMQSLIEDIWKHALYDSRFGKLPSENVEVDGEILQVCSRLYWLTGDQRYREWVFRLTDHYFLDEDILAYARLQLDDHSCEIIGGLSEGYVIAAKTDAERWQKYRPRMHAILDRVLEYGRNPDGLLWHTVDPRSGKVLNDDLTDNWGYNYNAFLTVAEIDDEPSYREAVRHVLENIHKYTDFPWENNGADGFADSVEGGINLLNRLPVESAWQWVDESMAELLTRQDDSGIIEGWHGDGNSARTALMWALKKTQGVSASPWRDDLLLGAVPEGDGVLLYVRSKYPWHGQLRFDRKRHEVYFHMPLDYARLNQFPEWFTVDGGKRYRVSIEGESSRTADGVELWDYDLTLNANQEVWLAVVPE